MNKNIAYDIRTMPLQQMELWEDNPRTISKAEFDKLKSSIERKPYYMHARPIVISDRTGKNIIIAGNQRYKAVKALGWEEAPVIVFHCQTEDQEVEIAMVDNHNNGEWDVEMLANKFMDYPLEDWLGSDWEKMAGDFGKIEETTEDEAPEINEEEPPKTKLGEIYQLGNHRLMCGDSTKEEDVAELMNGEKADMVFTDPPYNVAIGSKNKTLNKLKGGNSIERDLEGDTFKSDEEAKEKLWFPAFKNMLINAKNTCAIYVTMPQGGTHMMMMMGMHDAGWKVKHELIWLKNVPAFSMGRLDYDYQHEPICFGWNKNHKKIGKGKFTKSVWQIDRPQKDGDHPTMKPIELIANALQNSSEINDAVLDLFGGSGSTLIACEQLGRKCFMMEIDPHYCDVIIKRWENFTGEKAVKIDG